MTKTIDITPTWSALIPTMVEVLKNPKASSGAKKMITRGQNKMDNLTEQELKAVFDVVNVFEPEDISHVYPEMATEEFMMDVLSAWKKMLKNLDTIKQN